MIRIGLQMFSRFTMAYRSAEHLLAGVFAKSHSAQLESLCGLSMSLVCVSLEDALDTVIEYD